MYINYMAVTVTGVVAGTLIGIMAILGFCCYPVDLIVLVAAGALTAHMSAGMLREQNELMANGAISGFIGGLIGGILYAVVAALFQAFSSLTMGDQYRTLCGTAPPNPIATGIMGVICCLPVFVVAGIILGALGALAYRALKKEPVITNP